MLPESAMPFSIASLKAVLLTACDELATITVNPPVACLLYLGQSSVTVVGVQGEGVQGTGMQIALVKR